MRVAIPVHNERVSPLFDTAQRIIIADIEDGREVERTEYALAGLPPGQRAKVLSEKSVSRLICGAISFPMMNLVAAQGISVAPNIAGYVDEVLRAYTAGTLFSPQFMMPGCWGRGGRGSRRRRGWRGMCR
jgi:predicted Fe-Mo cluster-binding NifX family protein